LCDAREHVHTQDTPHAPGTRTRAIARGQHTRETLAARLGAGRSPVATYTAAETGMAAARAQRP